MNQITEIRIVFRGEEGLRNHSVLVQNTEMGLIPLDKASTLYSRIEAFLDKSFDFLHGAKGNLVLSPGGSPTQWLATGRAGIYIEGIEDELDEDASDDARFSWRTINNKPVTL